MRCQVAIGTSMVIAPAPRPRATYTRWRNMWYSGLPDCTAATSEDAEVIITRPRPSSARQPASSGKSTSTPRPLISGEG